MENVYRTGASSARDSSLTFAVIWDPENGLEAFSSAQLFETPAEVSVAGYDFDCWSDESDSVQTEEEPFAVFGGRRLHFIDIRTANMYKNIIGVDDEPSSPSSVYSKDSWRSSCCFVDEGIIENAPKPSRSATTRVSQDSFFVLNGRPTWKARREEAKAIFSATLLKPTAVDDDGFFDVSSHADCDPHLPSRFSISDTSTSAYVAVSRALSGPSTPMAPFHRVGTLRTPSARPASNLKTGTDTWAARASWACKLPRCGSLIPSPRKLLAPWMKRPRRDECWVLVEVWPVVMERVVDG